MISDMRDRWMRLGASLGWENAAKAFERIAHSYSEDGRYYHTLDHVRDCLEIMDSHGGDDVLELAVWFHDAVYDPRAADNEKRSADVLRQAAEAAGMTAETVNRACRLVEITDHRMTPLDDQERLIVDIDLSILGASAETYDRYSRNVRLEYAHVAEEAYCTGRTAVLRSFLNRERIYSGDGFVAEYEAKARENIMRELARLRRE